jgi:acyl carrier protein
VQIVTAERFITLFANEFQLDEQTLSRDTYIVQDLDFDSLELFRLMLFVEMLAPIDLPDRVNFDELTLGSIYDHYAAEAVQL